MTPLSNTVKVLNRRFEPFTTITKFDSVRESDEDSNGQGRQELVDSPEERENSRKGYDMVFFLAESYFYHDE